MLSVVLLNQLLEKENHYSRFADLCRDKCQGLLIKLMTSVLQGLQDPLFSLQALMTLRDHALTNQIQGVVKHFLTCVQVDEITYSEIFQQLVLEYCVVGAITYILHHYLQVIHHARIFLKGSTQRNKNGRCFRSIRNITKRILSMLWLVEFIAHLITICA